MKIQLLKKQLLLSASVGAVAAVTPAAVTSALAGPPTPAPVYTWTGFYVGANAGYSWGSGAVTYNEAGLGEIGLPTSIPGSSNLDGAIGGGQIGYNFQLNNSWVTGLEADLQLADEKGSSNFSYGADIEGVTGTLNSRIDWFGTVRGRLGWLFSPTTMVYATGGLAYGRVSASGFFTPNFGDRWSFDQAATNFGWTAGAGIEGAFPNSPNWTWKIEYLYLDLGSLSGSGESEYGPYTWNAKFTDNILRVGGSWHFY